MPLHKTKTPAKKPATTLAGKNATASRGKPAGVAAKAANGKYGSGKPAPPSKAPQPPAPAAATAKLQLQAFERAIQLFHKRDFRAAREWFEKARQGPGREIAANAATHIRMCERRLAAPAPEPKSAEERYNYAVALINLRDLAAARKHLELALQQEPRADHVHYALAVCLALSGDAPGAYDSLKRAIEIQPRNRMVARQDSDLEKIGQQPLFSRLLYPEKA